MLISDTRKKSIVSADLRSGMKGKCQKVFLNLLIEKRKKKLLRSSIFLFYTVVLILKICLMSSQFYFFPVHPTYWWYLQCCIISQIHQMQCIFWGQSCPIQIISSFPKANRLDILTSLCPVSFTPIFSLIDFLFFCVSWDLTSFFQNIFAPQKQVLKAKENVALSQLKLCKRYFFCC